MYYLKWKLAHKIFFFGLLLGLSVVSCESAKQDVASGEGGNQAKIKTEKRAPKNGLGSPEISKNDKVSSPDETKSVTVEKVKEQEKAYTRYYLAKVQSSAHFMVASEITGTLVKRYVEIGDRVKKGQVLGELKPLSTGLQVNNYKIRSPLSGRVADWSFDVGAIVKQSEITAEVYDDKQLYVTVYLTHNDRKLMDSGQYKLAAHAVDDGRSIAGDFKLISLSPKLDSATLTFPAKISINPKSFVALGAWLKVGLTNDHAKKIFVSPSALVSHGDAELVGILDDEDKVTWKEVVIGEREKDRVEVLKGLDSGQRIISHFKNKPSDGEKVKVLN